MASMSVVAACLTLAARAQGVRNDAATRVELARLGDGHVRSSADISAILCNAVSRGLLRLDLSAGRVYRITPAGQAHLSKAPRRAAASGRTSHNTTRGALNLPNWRKAPMVGNPLAPPLPKPERVTSVGISATFAGGELSRLKPGQYAVEAGCCAARARR